MINLARSIIVLLVREVSRLLKIECTVKWLLFQ